MTKLVSPLVFLLALGCSGSDEKGSDPAYPEDARLRMNQIQMLATHNSYHVEVPGNPVPDWHYSRDPLDVQLGAQGVRGLELDTWYDAPTDSLAVHHIPTVDDGTVCDTLVSCLTILLAWSDAHPGHHPLFVQIEPKESDPVIANLLPEPVDYVAYAEALDRTIRSVWPAERIITPDLVQGSDATLRDAVTTRGWPTLGQSRGKILFYLNERAGLHDVYTRGGSDVSGRVAFPESHADEPIGAVLVQNNPTDTAAEIPAHVQQGFIVRTMVDGVPLPANADERRAAGLASGAHILSSDYPVAAADGGAAAFTIPGGTPSRCNPITAAAACVSEDIENPAQLAP